MSKPKYKMTIRWGAVDDDMLLEVADRTKTYSFNTLGELQAFAKCAEEAEGWLNYEILKTEPDRWLPFEEMWTRFDLEG